MQQIPIKTIPNTTAVGGKIHVRLTSGFFQNLRRGISIPLLVMYFLLVWVQIDGHPWLLFDFAGQKIVLFSVTLSWHDLPLLAGIMIAGTCLLFFAAVAWGRVWCGFACPQSIWTWLFIRIETFVEGRANVRKRNEHQPLKSSLLIKRITKHLLWLVAAFLTALTFSGYFIPIRDLCHQLINFEASYTVIGWLVMMTTLTYLNAGLVREKVCFHMCPYSRFQGVMFDADTRTVSYDAARGEPRSNARNADDNSGDCVDCGLCVQVCPTGIDIRDGLQYECIDCGACIDACDAVMDKLDRPKRLIGFKSEHQLEKKPSKLLRPRFLGYGAVMLTAFIAVGYGFSTKDTLVFDVLRDRSTLSYTNSDGELCNSYLFKLRSVKQESTVVNISINAPTSFYLVGPKTITLSNDKQQGEIYQLCQRKDSVKYRQQILFMAESNDQKLTKQATFLASQ